jgi:hypothetical protein
VTEGLSFINTCKISFLVRLKDHKMVDYHKYRRRKGFEAMLSVFARML